MVNIINDDFSDIAVIMSSINPNEVEYVAAIGPGGAIEIEKVDDLNIFISDEEAVDAAIKDGIPIIPIKELPLDFKYRWLGWIDTPRNRKRIKQSCKEARFQTRVNLP